MNATNSAVLSSASIAPTKRDDPRFMSTQQLILGAQNGDKSAVGHLLIRHRSSLVRLVQMRLDKKIRNRVAPSDVVQDVLVEVNRRLPKYLDSPPMPFHLWVRQIARDRIIDAHRHHRGSAKRSVDREQRMVTQRGYDQSSIHLAALLGESRIAPAEVMIRKEMALKVESAIAMLDSQASEIIVMRHYEHLTNQEIANVLGVSEPAASMRYLRAIRRLKGLMQNSDMASVGE